MRIKNIGHRDIKPENIIYFHNNFSFLFKLCDLGAGLFYFFNVFFFMKLFLGKKVKNATENLTLVATIPFASPEVIAAFINSTDIDN